MRFKLIGSMVGALLVLMTVGAAPVLAQDGNAIRVMSYNIRYENTIDGVNVWSARRQNVAHMMGLQYAADIIGVQEAMKSQVDYLAGPSILGGMGYEWVGVGRGPNSSSTPYDPNLGEFAPVFYRADRFEVLDFSTRWLSETPDVAGSIGWNATLPRIVTTVKFLDKQTNQEFYFFNTHFEHTSSQARNNSAVLLSGWITEATAEGVPVVVTGDFNATTNTTAIQTILNTPGINNSLIVSETPHQGPNGTSGVGSNWTNTPNGQPIDHIFVHDDVRVLTHRHAADMYGGRFPSDHLPVIADVVILPEPGVLGLLLAGAGVAMWRRPRGARSTR